MVHPLLKMEMRVHFKSRVFCNLSFHSVDGIRYTKKGALFGASLTISVEASGDTYIGRGLLRASVSGQGEPLNSILRKGQRMSPW